MPVPYRHRPISPTYPGRRLADLAGGGSALRRRPPRRLSWETEPLTHDLTIAGDIVAQLFASTTGSDSDWVVKLIDVYPEDYPENQSLAGYELMIADEILRGRFRKSFETSRADRSRTR